MAGIGNTVRELFFGGRFLIGQFVSMHGDVVSHVNISGVQVQDGGIYECTATNRVGQVRHSAELRVYGTFSDCENIGSFASSEKCANNAVTDWFQALRMYGPCRMCRQWQACPCTWLALPAGTRSQPSRGKKVRGPALEIWEVEISTLCSTWSRWAELGDRGVRHNEIDWTYKPNFSLSNLS